MSRTRIPVGRVELAALASGTIEAAPGPVIGLTDTGAAASIGPGRGHTLIVAWPGLGTTTVLRTLAAQYARRGTHVDVLDVSGQHAWARGQQRVHLHEDAGSIHRRLLQLADQVRAERKGRPRVVLVESDQTINTLLRFRHYPHPGGTGLDALTTVLAGGLLCGIRVVMACRAVPVPITHVAQDLFATRLLAAPTPRTWQLVGAPGAPVPDEPFRAGLMHLVHGGGHQRLRLLQLTPLQAAHLATTSGPIGTPTRWRRPRLRRRLHACHLARLAAPAASTFQIPRIQGDFR
ncbi:ATP-binding protein [Streptomyces sp. NPDC020800]|uniref:ATP-binding protein n=1 Tax=Streptomyces sp. NPDC020800 TaxID=3365092 RepID=UPI00378C4932